MASHRRSRGRVKTSSQASPVAPRLSSAALSALASILRSASSLSSGLRSAASTCTSWASRHPLSCESACVHAAESVCSLRSRAERNSSSSRRSSSAPARANASSAPTSVANEACSGESTKAVGFSRTARQSSANPSSERVPIFSRRRWAHLSTSSSCPFTNHHRPAAPFRRAGSRGLSTPAPRRAPRDGALPWPVRSRSREHRARSCRHPLGAAPLPRKRQG